MTLQPPNTAERFYVSGHNFAASTREQHLARYRFAAQHVAGRRVLDVACGSGYGTASLADAGAGEVVGVDLDADAVAYAKEHHGRENVTFEVDNAQQLSFGDASFDCVVSFETIEHLPNDEAFLGEVWRVLRPGGLFVVSTPDGRLESTFYGLTGRPRSRHHLREYTRDAFVATLESRFAVEELLGQVYVRPWLVPWPVQAAVKSAAYGLRRLGVRAAFDGVYHRGSGYDVTPAAEHGSAIAKYWLAVCRRP